jgi:uncharacterized membrane protein
VVLHYFVFPMMLKNNNSLNFTAAVATIFGAISTTSWLFASFVGAARYIAPYMNLQYFLALYAASLFAGICVGLLLVRSRIASSLHEAQPDTRKSTASDDCAAYVSRSRYARGREELLLNSGSPLTGFCGHAVVELARRP